MHCCTFWLVAKPLLHQYSNRKKVVIDFTNLLGKMASFAEFISRIDVHIGGHKETGLQRKRGGNRNSCRGGEVQETPQKRWFCGRLHSTSKSTPPVRSEQERVANPRRRSTTRNGIFFNIFRGESVEGKAPK
jgi:hypothetical protein